MMNTTKTQPQRQTSMPGHPNPAHRRGAILVLVVVAITLLALMGAAYLQVTRVQREKTVSPGNMNAEIQAILGQIHAVLKDDLIDTNGNLEMYDYPWTNPNQPWQVKGFYGNTFNAVGDYQDDTWLASSGPVDKTGSPGTAEWLHLTNLNGLYLDYNASLNGGAGGFVPSATYPGIPAQLRINEIEAPAPTNGTASDSDQTINTANPGQLVDADGDGIPDSRWTWGSLPQIGAYKYVMAVRIVDLSGKTNVNTATNLITAAGAYDTTAAGTNAPRWDSPDELDLGRFVFDLANSANRAAYMTNLSSGLLNFRMGATPAMPMPYVFTGNLGRRGAFYAQGRFATDQNQGPFNFKRFDSFAAGAATNPLDNEYELLYRNGLNNYATTTAIETLGTGMPLFLRANHSETTYTDVTGTLGTWYNTTGAPANPIEGYFAIEPRHQLTTVSGAAIFAPPPQTVSGTPGTFNPSSNNDFKMDLNYQLTRGVTGIQNIAARIITAYNDVLPTSRIPEGNATTFANQFAVNLADYADADSYLTRYTTGATTYYGMEALPFIAEVYVEGKYPAPNFPTKIIINVNGTPTQYWDLQWPLQTPPGFAIEIRNPFPFPIQLAGIHPWVIDSNGNATDLGDLATLAGISTLAPKQVLVLYHKAGDGTNGQDDNPGGRLSTATGLITYESGYTYIPVAVPVATFTWPTIPTAARTPTTSPTLPNITVELRATVHDASTGATAPANWAYDKATSVKLPVVYNDTHVLASLAPPIGGQFFYWQYDQAGDGRGLNMMAIPAADFKKAEKIPGDQAPNYKQFDTTAYQLGKADKANANASITLAGQQILIANRGYNDPFNGADKPIKQVGELMDLAWLAPQTTTGGGVKTIPQVWKAQTANPKTIDYFLLDFDPASGDVMNPSFDQYKVSPATFLLSQFTTLSPRVDGVDNNGNGVIDDNSENIVPGLVNINTAPQSLLDKILPIPNNTLRADVAKWIVEYRSGTPAQRAALANVSSTDVRQNLGIAYIGELQQMFAHQLSLASNPNPIINNADTYRMNATGTTGNIGTRTDFRANQSATTGDGIKDDREEIDTLTRWLTTVGSVRSDYFAAYVLVRGYDGGVVPANLKEQKRFIAVFRRNAVNGKIQITALLPNGGSNPYVVTP